MPRPEPKMWQSRKKHRKANPRLWDDGTAKSNSAEPHGESQYNPYEFGTDDAVRELEFRCVDQGIMIVDEEHLKKFYMDVGRVVGVCSGEETTFVLAEWCSGEVHGRPISKKALLRMGVKL
jgi:hypothetical protein